MNWDYLVVAVGLTLIIFGAVSRLMAAPHNIPRMDPTDILYTPCGQQLIETNIVTIQGVRCAQLIYADGSMNHICEKPLPV